MKKTFLLLLCSVLLFAVPVFFSACEEKDEPKKETIDGGVHDSMFGDYLKNVENLVGTFHYDEEITRWYAEDENHVRYYFLSTMHVMSHFEGAEEGKQVLFMGELFSVSNKWIKDHEQYKQYNKSGLYVFSLDSSRGKYTVDGTTYYCQMYFE